MAAAPTSPTSTWLATAAPTGKVRRAREGWRKLWLTPSFADPRSLHRKGREAPPAFKQFFSSAYTLSHVNLSATRLPLEALRSGGCGVGGAKGATGVWGGVNVGL